VRRCPGVHVHPGGDDDGAGRWSAATCAHASPRGLWARPATGGGALARVRTGGADRDVIWTGADRPLSHAYHMCMPSPRPASLHSPSNSGLCPLPSPSRGDSREIDHSMMRFGNDPFVGGTRPQMALNKTCDRTLMLPGSTTTHEKGPAFLRAQATRYNALERAGREVVFGLVPRACDRTGPGSLPAPRPVASFRREVEHARQPLERRVSRQPQRGGRCGLDLVCTRCADWMFISRVLRPVGWSLIRPGKRARGARTSRRVAR
jgi:hypothetical protein